MGISTRQVSVGTTAVQLVDATNVADTVALHTAGGSVYIGHSDVTSSTGYKLEANTNLVIDNQEAGIWAITASGTHTVHVLVIEK